MKLDLALIEASRSGHVNLVEALLKRELPLIQHGLPFLSQRNKEADVHKRIRPLT
jgi:hypothetical protein